MNSKSRIFGNEKKITYLLELIKHESCSGRELSRLCGLDHQEEFRITALFLNHRVIERDAAAQLVLNERFVASNELRNYLYALVDAPIQRKRRRTANVEGNELATLLGSEVRTRILVALSRAANGLTVNEIHHRFPSIQQIGVQSLTPLIRDELVVREQARAGRLFLARDLKGYSSLVAFLNRLGDVLEC